MFYTKKGYAEMNTEEWRIVPGFENYRVSNLGNVQRLWGTQWKDIKACRNKLGYLKVALSVDGKQIQKYVHRLVLLAFVGESQLQCDHLNADKTDNRLSNLEYVSNKENHRRATVMGLKRRGSSHGNSKLKEDDVIEIKQLIKLGERQVAIAKRFNISGATISAIRHGKLWAWLSI